MPSLMSMGLIQSIAGLIGTKPGLPVSKRILLPDDLRTGTSVLRILDLPDSILM